METERVQVIAASMYMSADTIPSEYIRPENEQPACTTYHGPIPDVPIIDFGDQDEKSLIETMVKASIEWGLFQIVNHDIPNDVIKKLKEVGTVVFRTPARGEGENRKGRSWIYEYRRVWYKATERS